MLCLSPIIQINRVYLVNPSFGSSNTNEMLKNELNNLKSIIKERYPNAKFENGLSRKDIKLFETEKKLKIPQDLFDFYHWHNGVKMSEFYYIPSLNEAYEISKQHPLPFLYKSRLAEFQPSSEEEIDRFLQSPNENIAWFPLLVDKSKVKTNMNSRVEMPLNSVPSFYNYDENLTIFFFNSLHDILELLKLNMTNDASEMGLKGKFKKILSDVNSLLNSL